MAATNMNENPLLDGASGSWSDRDTGESVQYIHNSSPYISSEDGFTTILARGFFKQPDWCDRMFDILFKLKRRKATIKSEVYFGFIQFISCVYAFAVIPAVMSKAGYVQEHTIAATALCCGIGSILSGLTSNLPFIIAPPAIAAIQLTGFLNTLSWGANDKVQVGNAAVLISGLLLMTLGYRPLHQLVGRLIPLPIQVGCAIGSGLHTTLAGAVEINLVVQGDINILQLGQITPEIMIAFTGIIIICTASRYHIKASFCLCLITCTLVWWIYSKQWPASLASVPALSTINSSGFSVEMIIITCDLLLMYVIFLNGLISSLSALGGLTRPDGSIPRGRWIFIITGGLTVCSACFAGAPVLISPESAAGIKVGARTGLSAVVCGLFFLAAIFFTPIFAACPAAATAPILIGVGILMFQNVSRLDWTVLEDCAPAFITLIFIPFTYSLVTGVTMGFVVYIIIDILAGDFYFHTIDLIVYLLPSLADYFTGRESKLTQVTHADGRDSVAATVGGLRNSLAYPMALSADVTEHAAYNMTLLGAESGADYTRRQLRDLRLNRLAAHTSSDGTSASQGRGGGKETAV